MHSCGEDREIEYAAVPFALLMIATVTADLFVLFLLRFALQQLLPKICYKWERTQTGFRFRSVFPNEDTFAVGHSV